MKEYHKIQTVFERDPETKYKTLLIGKYANPAFEYLAENKWVFTEKVDGTNIRIGTSNGTGLAVKGRTDNASIPTFLLTHLMSIFRPEKLVEVCGGEDFCLYGEGYGAKIQKGGGNYKADGVDFVLFDVRIGEWWLRRPDVEDVAEKLNIRTVPIIGTGTLEDMVSRARSGFKSQWGEFQAEGIVARPAAELQDRGGHRIITKIKIKDFHS